MYLLLFQNVSVVRMLCCDENYNYDTQAQYDYQETMTYRKPETFKWPLVSSATLNQLKHTIAKQP